MAAAGAAAGMLSPGDGADTRAQVLALLNLWSDPSISAEVAAATEASIKRVCAHTHTPALFMSILEAQPPLPRHIRMLILMLILNDVIARHWNESRATIEAEIAQEKDAHTHAHTHTHTHAITVVSESDKGVLRARLLLLLGDPDCRIRDAAARCIVSIGAEDYPEAWPEFLHMCVHTLGRAGEGAWVPAEGALRVLTKFMEECEVDTAVPLAQAVLPAVLSIATGEAMVAQTRDERAGMSKFALSVRTQALLLCHSLVGDLGKAADAGSKSAVRSFLKTHTLPLLNACAAALAVPGMSPYVVAFKNAAFRCLMEFMQSCPALVKPYLPAVVAGVLGTVPSIVNGFVAMDVDDGEVEEPALPPSALDAAADTDIEDDPTGRPEILAIDLVAFFQVCACSKSKVLKDTLRTHAADIAMLLLSFCQLTDAALDSWEEDPHTFLNDTEEDALAMNARVRDDMRMTFMDFFHVLSKDYTGLVAVSNALATALSPSAMPGQRTGWLALSQSKWKTVEAVIFVFGLCYKEFYAHKMQAAEGTSVPPLPVDVNIFITQLLGILRTGGSSVLSDVNAAERAAKTPYVLGRSMWAIAQVSKAATPEQRMQLVLAAADGLDERMAVPIRLAASVSLSKVVRKLDTSIIEQVAGTLLTRLASLMLAPSTTNDSLVSLVALVSVTSLAAPTAAAAAAPALLPVLLSAWCKFANDPVLQPGTGDALQVFVESRNDAAAGAAIQACLPVVLTMLARAVDRATPVIAGVRMRMDLNVLDCALPSALKLLASMVRRLASSANITAGTAGARVPPSPEVAAAVAHTLRLLGETSSSGIMQWGCEVVATAVRVHGVHLLAAGVDATGLLSVLSRSFSGALTATTTRFTAPVATAVVSTLSDHAGGPLPIIPSLLPAVLNNLAQSDTKNAPSLLMVLSHMVMSDTTRVAELLVSASVPLPATGMFAAAADSSASHAITVAAALAADHAAAAGPVMHQAGVILYLRAVARFFPLLQDHVTRLAVAYACMRLLALPIVLEAGMGWSVPSDRQVLPSGAATPGKGTRSKTKAAGAVHPMIPLTVRVLSQLVHLWAEHVDDENNAGDDEATTTSDEGSGGDDDDDDEEGEDGAAAAAEGAAAHQKPRRGRARRGLYMDADFAQNMYGDLGADDEMLMLSDLLGGGDALGTGVTLADAFAGVMRRLQGGGHGSDDDDAGSGDEADAADDEECAWDEAPDDAALPHDAVVQHLRASRLGTDAGDVFAGLVRLAHSGNSAAAALLSAVLQELDDGERTLLNERVVPRALASP